MNKEKQLGYLILEIPISIFIFGVALLTYAAASNSIVLNRSVKFQELANQIAVSKIEDIRQLSYESLPSSGPFSHSLLNSLPQGTADLQVSNYNDKTKQITVTVTWQEFTSSIVKRVILDTLKTQQGL